MILKTEKYLMTITMKYFTVTLDTKEILKKDMFGRTPGKNYLIRKSLLGYRINTSRTKRGGVFSRQAIRVSLCRFKRGNKTAVGYKGVF